MSAKMKDIFTAKQEIIEYLRNNMNRITLHTKVEEGCKLESDGGDLYILCLVTTGKHGVIFRVYVDGYEIAQLDPHDPLILKYQELHSLGKLSKELDKVDEILGKITTTKRVKKPWYMFWR